MADMEVNGVREPLEMVYGKEIEGGPLVLILTDGNHRAKAAFDLRIPRLPIVVDSWYGVPPGLEGAPQDCKGWAWSRAH